VQLVDASGVAVPNVTFSPASFHIDNGVSVDVTVRLEHTPSSVYSNAAPFMIVSTDSNHAHHIWPGVVTLRRP
jgi:hypothetical protein